MPSRLWLGLVIWRERQNGRWRSWQRGRPDLDPSFCLVWRRQLYLWFGCVNGARYMICVHCSDTDTCYCCARVWDNLTWLDDIIYAFSAFRTHHFRRFQVSRILQTCDMAAVSRFQVLYFPSSLNCAAFPNLHVSVSRILAPPPQTLIQHCSTICLDLSPCLRSELWHAYII